MAGTDTSIMANRAARRSNLSHTPANAAEQAREQAEAYNSLFADREIELDNGEILTIPPHPDFGMLDDDCTEAYEELQFEADTQYVRDPDIIIPEHRMKNEAGVEYGPVIPEEIIRGALKRPFRKLVDGEEVLVKPPFSVQQVKAAIGDDKFKLLKEGGRGANDVWRVWGQQGMEVRARQATDTKSNGGAVGVASVSEADSE